VTSGGNKFNYFPANQLTKFRVFIGESGFLSSPLNFCEASHLIPHRMDAPDRHHGQTDKRTACFCRLDGANWLLCVIDKMKLWLLSVYLL